MLEPGTRSAKNYHFHLSDHVGPINDSYGGYHIKDYGNRPRKTAENYSNYMGSLTGTHQSKVVDDDESEFCSPPLWKTSPTASPQHRRNHYRSLSPSSKAQAIARGQRELMEMVSKMPEACYELSLKDLVEQPVVELNKQESFKEENNKDGKSFEDMHRRDQTGVLRKTDHKKRQMKRSGSLNNKNNNEGFLLKMVFPLPFGSKKTKKKKDLALNTSSKVSPKSPAPDGSDKGADKEWWKKSFSVSSESSESTGTSSNSGSAKSSASSSSSRHGRGGCWSFIRTRKSIKAA